MSFGIEPPAPFHGITRIAKRQPIQATFGAVAVVALQGIFDRLHHVGGRPVHLGLGKAILTAVLQAHDLLCQDKGVVPIEVGPVAVFASRDRRQQVIVYRVVRLLGNMKFEGEDFCLGIFYTSSRYVDIGDLVWIDLITQQVAIGQIAVEPDVGGLEVLFVNKRALDLQVGIVIFGYVLTSSGPIPVGFGGILDRHGGDVAGLAGNRLYMGIEALVGMQCLAVAVGAGYLLQRIDRVIIGDQATEDLMIFGGMAGGALEIQAAHVHIQ